MDAAPDTLPNLGDLPPPPIRCRPETPDAELYCGIWYKWNTTPDGTIERDISAIHSMLLDFIEPKYGDVNDCLETYQAYYIVKFVTSCGKSVEITIGFHTWPFTVIVAIDGNETVFTSSDAGFIRKSIEKVIMMTTEKTIDG